MKLLFELSKNAEVCFSKVKNGEEILYCTPFTIENDNFVDGFIVITKTRIIKICDGEITSIYNLSDCSDFKTERMYGSCAFLARINGNDTIICRFIAGRHLPRYQTISKACEILCEDSGQTITSNKPERYCPKCSRPYVPGTTVCSFCIDKKVVYKKLWALTKGLRFMMFSPFIISGITLLLNFVSPYLQKIAINSFFQPENPHFQRTSEITVNFIFLAVTIVLVACISTGLGVLQNRLLAVASARFLVILHSLLYEKIQKLSLSSTQKKSTGDLMSRVSNDTEVIRSFIVDQVPHIFFQVASLIVAGILLLFVNWIMALFIIVPIPFAIFIINKFWVFIRRSQIKIWVVSTRQSRLLHNVLKGIKVVKTYGKEKIEVKRFEKANEKTVEVSAIGYKSIATIIPILSFVTEIGRYLILLYGSILILGKRMLFGDLQYFNSLAAYVYSPLISLTNIPNILSQFLTSSSKIFELLEETIEVDDIVMPIDIKIEGDIEVKNITFGYESYEPVLDNISFSIKQGETVGIVGLSGSGKTTLTNLIMRLYDVNEGEILIDEVNIKDISQHCLRSQMGVVLQETFLFVGTIRDNIAYAKPYATEEEIIEAARIANAHDFIVTLPDGYNTWVGENGYTMSGGERQRIAIARAILHNPKILILDEATASLDTETERLIQEALYKISKNRTTIAIAHRLSTLRNADRLIVLDKGKLKEIGTHDELYAKKGIYYDLVMAQREMQKSNIRL